VLTANGIQSGSEDAQSASSSRDHQYRPQHDPHYAEVARPIRNNYAHLANAMNNPALNVGFGSPYGVAQASPSAGDAVHHSFGSGFNAPQGGQAHPAEANQAQHIWYPPQVTQISQQTPGYDHTGPYNAVGYVPVNGEIHDRSELYEEYRLSEHGEELNEDDSDSWYNVKAHASY
jgi:hypothetical protein